MRPGSWNARSRGVALSQRAVATVAFLAAMPALARSCATQGARLCRTVPGAARWVLAAALHCVRLSLLAILAVAGLLLWLAAAAIAAVWTLGARGLARLR